VPAVFPAPASCGVRGEDSAAICVSFAASVFIGVPATALAARQRMGWKSRSKKGRVSVAAFRFASPRAGPFPALAVKLLNTVLPMGASNG
jgi:hypothetical protein